LVLASEFAGLADRCGYLRYGNHLVKLKITPVPSRDKRVAFVPRQGTAVAKASVPTVEEYLEAKRVEKEELTGQPAKSGRSLLPRPQMNRSANPTE
jgi:hypothetical protein